MPHSIASIFFVVLTAALLGFSGLIGSAIQKNSQPANFSAVWSR